MRPFDDIRLPEDIEQGAEMGPSFRTSIVNLSNGGEQRNADWQQERFEADISYGLMEKQNPQDAANSFARIMQFYRARMGRLRGFRFRDWSDFEALNIPLKMINPSYARLIIEYDDTYSRVITRPVFDTIDIPGKPAFQLLPGGYILFNSPRSADTTVSFQFDVPVRFDTDVGQVKLTHLNAGSIPSMKVIQCPDPPTPELLEALREFEQ